MARKIIEQKQKQVDAILEKVKRAKGIVVVDYRGINVADDTALRQSLRKNKIDYKVLKNSLVLRAFNEAGHKGMEGVLKGPTAVAMSYDDATSPARLINENVKKIGKLTVKGGVVEGKVLDAAGIKAVASIPKKEVLLAQLLGLLTSPMRSFAVAVNEVAKTKA